MIDTVWDLEIQMMVPFDTMVYYPDDFKDEYIEEPLFAKIREFLKIDLDVNSIVEELYKNRGKNSCISIYYSNESFKDFILVDTEIDPSDQLDLIRICICCSKHYSGVIREYAHKFYASRSKYNITYSEGFNEILRKYGFDFSSFNGSANFKFRSSEIIGRKLKLFQGGELLREFKVKFLDM
ncbi:hypothetical protein [Clostridium sp. C8-1-8]|uniref:hypothetical protein n=1 Tax=Clostridium sp. C8-1-8 TaxID=2698831 RepID=UPI00136C1B26|nr:hypothetical protein [Clostridium sp. C8-1-8]